MRNGAICEALQRKAKTINRMIFYVIDEKEDESVCALCAWYTKNKDEGKTSRKRGGVATTRTHIMR